MKNKPSSPLPRLMCEGREGRTPFSHIHLSPLLAQSQVKSRAQFFEFVIGSLIKSTLRSHALFLNSYEKGVNGNVLGSAQGWAKRRALDCDESCLYWLPLDTWRIHAT